MNTNQVLLLDSDADRSGMLESFLLDHAINSSCSTSVNDSLQQLGVNEFALVVVDFELLAETGREESGQFFNSLKDKRFVLYNLPKDVHRQLPFYRLNATRVFDQRTAPEEIGWFCVNLLNAPIRGDNEDSPIAGKLAEFPLSELLLVFGREKRSGVLKLNNTYGTGKLYLHEGHVIEAHSGNLTGESAALFLLTWRSGKFYFRPSQPQLGHSRIALSNPGLLIKAGIYREKYYNSLKILGRPGTRLRLVNRGDLEPELRDAKLKSLAELMAQPQRIQEIIEHSPLSPLETLDWLVSIRHHNLEITEEAITGDSDLVVRGNYDAEQLSKMLLSRKNVEKLRMALNAEDTPYGKLLILGSEKSGKTELIRHLLNTGDESFSRVRNVEFARVALAEDFFLLVYGLLIDRNLTEYVMRIADGLLGYVFLVDARKEEDFEYTLYMMKTLSSTFSLPWLAVFTNHSGMSDQEKEQIRERFSLDPTHIPEFIDLSGKKNAKELFIAFFTGGDQ
jgi:signal recognition particle receptor subunit beta